MDYTLYLFFIFSSVLIVSALIVISARNMVHSVMFLILCFVNAAMLFVLLGAEFLAMLLIVVYVGAIAVLFLFVVMMLNVDVKQVAKKANLQLPLLIVVGLVLFIELVLIIKFAAIQDNHVVRLFPISNEISNVHAIGNVLYTDFLIPFQLAGAILFVAMIGAIVLTLKDDRIFIRKQIISKQTARNKENSIEIIKVKSGEGIDL